MSERPDWKAMYFAERAVLHGLLHRLGVSLPSAPKEPAMKPVVVPPVAHVPDEGLQRLAATIRAARPTLSETEAEAAAREALAAFTHGTT